MSIVETIQKRRSVRTYTGEPLRREHVIQIEEFIHRLQAPFGARARIELMGIALCHFELACQELAIEGKFEILKDFPDNDKLEYVISWLKNSC